MGTSMMSINFVALETLICVWRPFCFFNALAKKKKFVRYQVTIRFEQFPSKKKKFFFYSVKKNYFWDLENFATFFFIMGPLWT